MLFFILFIFVIHTLEGLAQHILFHLVALFHLVYCSTLSLANVKALWKKRYNR